MSKILVVDDSPMMRDGLARLLDRKGYTVSTADSGRSAWITLYQGLPDLIVLDLMMPEIHGLTFLRMLRSHHHWKGLPVLVLTGLDHDESLVQEAKTFGVVDILHKNGDNIDVLLSRIDALFPQNARANTLTVNRGHPAL